MVTYANNQITDS